MTESGVYKIKPAGRHLLTIGRDLIQDVYAAVVELVKNAYDADSPDVTIEFPGKSNKRKNPQIIISDHGHGMSRETVINKWMVPSTPDKLKRKTSPNGRVMQGRKGVGRYAASTLGKDLFLETIHKFQKTSVFIEWSGFEEAEFLEDVDVLIETKETSEVAGTKLTINLDDESLAYWNNDNLNRLRKELKKLKSPVDIAVGKDDFSIELIVRGFPEIGDFEESVKPFPILELYDYRISGTVTPDGKGKLIYAMQKVKNSTEQSINYDYGKPTGCGELQIDIRVYDREANAIDSLINRGLKDESGHYVGKQEARRILNEHNGIGVYRNRFRIRPLGDPDFDWLKLNEQRIQNPSMRIGSNQAIGYVQIQSEEKSDLIEKSARDGLRENMAFEQLKAITKEVIAELETKRFDYRKRAELSRPGLKLEREFERIFSSDELKQGVKKQLRNKVSQETIEKVISLIEKDEESKNQLAEDIRNTVAVYQGQATLGKIISVVLHEGRRPLSYFRNQIPRFLRLINSFSNNADQESREKIKSIAIGVRKNAEFFVTLFSRLDPLAAGKRGPKKPVNLKVTVQDAIAIFTQDMESAGIHYEINSPDNCQYSGWHQDIHAIFTNLIDNSVYWMREKNSKERKISININTDSDQFLSIDYRDTGPGIEPSLIASKLIFEPEFSTKPEGTGLGLAIAGEAADRNGLNLVAQESDNGAWFQLRPIDQNEDDEK